MVEFDKNGPKTIQLQLYEYILNLLHSDQFLPNQLFLSENEICEMFSISRSTVRAVLAKLVDQDYLYRIAGKGTFVSERKINTFPTSGKSLREQFEELGYETETHLVSKEAIPASDALSDVLNVEKGTLLYCIKRVRTVDGIPISLHSNYLVANLFPGIINMELDKVSLCSIQKEKYGFEAKRGDETLEIVTATPEEASLLHIDEFSRFLLLSCVMYSKENVAYEYSKVFYRGDCIRLQISFERSDI